MNPEMLQQIMGGGGQGPPPDQGPEGGAGDSEAQPIDILKKMIDLAQQYMSAEEDDEDKATMAKTLATLQSYLAKDQKDRAAAMGTSPAVKALARQSRNPI